MKIGQDHLLTGVALLPVRGLQGGREMRIRRALVIHYTEGTSGRSSIDWWQKDPKCIEDDIGAHLVIDRDGTVTQCRAFNRTISHAGTSRWRDPKTGKLYVGLNSCAIGIELANTGSVCNRIRGEEGLRGYAGQATASHRNGGGPKAWELYPEPQIAACEAVARALVEHYNLDDVTGHDCIAPERKTDPGPLFPMERLRLACGFTGLPVVHHA